MKKRPAFTIMLFTYLCDTELILFEPNLPKHRASALKPFFFFLADRRSALFPVGIASSSSSNAGMPFHSLEEILSHES